MVLTVQSHGLADFTVLLQYNIQTRRTDSILITGIVPLFLYGCTYLARRIFVCQRRNSAIHIPGFKAVALRKTAFLPDVLICNTIRVYLQLGLGHSPAVALV